jgi:hypothetical protein
MGGLAAIQPPFNRRSKTVVGTVATRAFLTPRWLSRARPLPSERICIALCRDAFELEVATFYESRWGLEPVSLTNTPTASLPRSRPGMVEVMVVLASSSD